MSGNSPLAGKRVVNTRAPHQAAELDRLLTEHGAIPLSFPCIAIRPPSDVGPLDAALSRLVKGTFDWVVFTSANTVEAVAGRLDDVLFVDQSDSRIREPARGSPATVSRPGQSSGVQDPDLVPRHLAPPPCHPERSEGSWWSPSAKVAVVAPVTAEAVSGLLGWRVDFAPGIESAAELGRTLPIRADDRVLLPKSAIAGPALAAILNGRGAAVTEVVAYETETGAGGVDLASLLAAGEVDAICFTSGSTVRGCLDRLGGAALPDAVRVACIGGATADVARSLGLRVDVVPATPTARAMVETLAACFAMNETTSRG